MATGAVVLRDLVFVVRELQVGTAAVDVELLAQILGAHGRALEVPAGEAHRPGRLPPHQVAGIGLDPQRKIGRVALLVLPLEVVAALGDEILDLAARQLAIHAVVGNEFGRVEIDRAIDHVGIAAVEDGLDHVDLFDDVAGSARLDAGRQHVEHAHHLVEAQRVALHDLHGLHLLQARLLGDLVLAAHVDVALEMPHIGDVAHVAHLVADVLQVTKNDIEADEGAAVAQVHVAVHRRTAYIHAHLAGHQRFERLFLSRQTIVNDQIVFHGAKILFLSFPANVVCFRKMKASFREA